MADIRDEDGKKVEAEINEAGGEAIFIHLDVTSSESWENALNEVEAKLGKLNILVNNAGISSSSQEDNMGIEGWDLILDVNAKGPFLGCRAVIPRMIANGGGSIVNISSDLGTGRRGCEWPPGV